MGVLISISGLDGSGKTTHCLELTDWLLGRGKDVLYTHSMQPPLYYNELRRAAQESNMRIRDLFSPTLIGLAVVGDFERIVETVVRPALLQSRIVITDRYDLDSAVCTASWGGDVSVSRKVVAFFPKPDLHFFLDVSPETVGQRIQERDNTILRKRDIRLLKAQRLEYSNLLLERKDVIQIDAGQPFSSVQNELRKHVRTHLTTRG